MLQPRQIHNLHSISPHYFIINLHQRSGCIQSVQICFANVAGGQARQAAPVEQYEHSDKLGHETKSFFGWKAQPSISIRLLQTLSKEAQERNNGVKTSGQIFKD